MTYRLTLLAASLLLSALPYCLRAADTEGTSDVIPRIIQFLSEDENQETMDYEEHEERLYARLLNPIDINRTTRHELGELPFLSDTEVERLLYYVYVYGPVESIYELQMVDGLRPLSLQFLIPFIRLGQADDISWRDAMRSAGHTLFAHADTEVERRKGYTNGQYPGLPAGGQFKYRVQASDRLYAGLTFEHDAGEPFFSQSAGGFDLYRAYVEARVGRHVSVCAGDFRVSFGRGLLFGERGYGGKMDLLSRSAANSSGISHYGGTDETDFFRGAAVSAAWGGWSIEAFYSYRHYDADTSGGSFSTFRTGGLHRTVSERQSRHTVGVHSAALHAAYSGRHFEIGLTAGGSCHPLPRILPDAPYYRHMFAGNMQAAVSADYRLFFRSVRLYGETAVNQSPAVATVNTLAVSPLSALDIYLNHRYYSPRYDIYFSRAISSGSRVNNEHGATIGFSLRLPRRWSLEAYADLYRHMWVTYIAATPTSGWEARCDASYTARNDFSLKFTARYRSDYKDYSLSSPMKYVVRPERYSLRTVARYKAGYFRFVSGIEGKAVNVGGNVHYGMMLAQDAVCELFKGRMEVSCSAILFDADSWDNRFYWYERNIPGSGYSSSLYGTGCRWYVMLCGRPYRNLTLGVRIAQTWYAGGESYIGSGNDITSGNHRTGIGAYIKWRL